MCLFEIRKKNILQRQNDAVAVYKIQKKKPPKIDVQMEGTYGGNAKKNMVTDLTQTFLHKTNA